VWRAFPPTRDATSVTCATVLSFRRWGWENTRETVDVDTPAAAATTLIVGAVRRPSRRATGALYGAVVRGITCSARVTELTPT
jgi:hypothetical protein